MVTVSHIAHRLVDEKTFLREAISKGIASYGSIAKQLKPDIEKELGKQVEHFAIIAALQRYAENVDEKFKDIKFNANTSEVNLKSNIIDINVLKTQNLFDKLKRFYDIVHFEKGDIINIIYGRNSVTSLTNERYREKIFNFLQNQKINKIEENLVALSFTIGKKLVDTPGVLFQISRSFAWENINIIEIISIDLEITFIIEEKDAIRGYEALQKLIT